LDSQVEAVEAADAEKERVSQQARDTAKTKALTKRLAALSAAQRDIERESEKTAWITASGFTDEEMSGDAQDDNDAEQAVDGEVEMVVDEDEEVNALASSGAKSRLGPAACSATTLFDPFSDSLSEDSDEDVIPSKSKAKVRQLFLCTAHLSDVHRPGRLQLRRRPASRRRATPCSVRLLPATLVHRRSSKDF
jgi:hypothetical protein